jgi:LPS export ABC transporter protein LptC/lipopolysaccharide transport protein LptA
MKKRYIFTSLAVLLSIILYFSFKENYNIATLDIDFLSSYEESIPGMFIEEFNLREESKKDINWVLDSKNAIMYEKKGFIEFKDVTTDIYKKDYKLYALKSDKGKYLIKKDKIKLLENVTIKTNNGFLIKTDFIDYDSKKRTVKTNSFVEVDGFSNKDKIHLEGYGVEGFLDQDVFYLKSNVKANLSDDMTVKSNNAKFSSSEKNATFLENVRANKSGIEIKADILKISYDENTNLNDIYVYNHVVLKFDNKEAMCEQAVILNSSKKIVMYGNPELYVENDVIVGEKIEFYTDSDEVYVSKVKAEVEKGGM